MSDHEDNAPKPEPEQLNIKVKDGDVSVRDCELARLGWAPGRVDIDADVALSPHLALTGKRSLLQGQVSRRAEMDMILRATRLTSSTLHRLVGSTPSERQLNPRGKQRLCSSSCSHDSLSPHPLTPHRLAKLQKAYAERMGKPFTAIRFVFDGQRINDEDTAESMGMEDGDEIDAMNEQVVSRRAHRAGISSRC